MFELLGWIATLCFSGCYLPQIWKTFKRKEVKDVSIGQWVIQLTGYFFGLVYGFWLHQGPLIFGYSFGLLCTLVYIILYFQYYKKEE